MKISFQSAMQCLLSSWDSGLPKRIRVSEACDSYRHKFCYLLNRLIVNHVLEKRHKLAIAVARSLKVSLLAPVLPRLCLMGFTFAQPLLVDSALKYLGDDNSHSDAVGYGLLLAYGLVYLGIAVSAFVISDSSNLNLVQLSTSWYWHLTFRFVTKVRGGLISIIFDKSLLLDSSDPKDTAAMTLVSADINRIAIGLKNVHELWASLIEFGLGGWLLQRQIGVAFLPMIVLCLGMP